MAFNLSKKSIQKVACQQALRFNSTTSKLVVNSHNEFDPLEEVIVGRVEGATLPEWHVAGKAVWPTKWWDMYKTKGGQPFPKDLMDKGNCFDLSVDIMLNMWFS